MYKKRILDEKWFSQFSQIGLFSIVDFFVGDPLERKQQKKKFLTDKIRNPELDYPKITAVFLNNTKIQLVELLKKIKNEELNKLIKQSYTKLIEEKLAHLEILNAVNAADDIKFNELTINEFGKPSPDVLSRLIPSVFDMLGQASASKNKLVQQACDQLKQVISNISQHADPILKSFVPQEEATVESKQIKDRFEKAFVEYGIENWNTVIDIDNLNSFININQKEQTVFIPSSRNISPLHLEALVKHEIGVHIRRRINAEKQAFKLLTIGLDHYLKGDEGLSKYEEIKIFPSSFNSTVEIYLGISLIHGLGRAKMDFRDIYEFFYSYYLVSRHSESNITTDDAENYSWVRAEKFFRGTTGQSKGICFTKDLIYLHGYLDILEVLKKHPEEEKRFLVGKYDPANKFHRQVLDELKISLV